MPAILVPFVLDWHSTSVAEAACIEVKENDFSAQAMGSLRAAERPGRFPLPVSSGFMQGSCKIDCLVLLSHFDLLGHDPTANS